MLLLTHGDFDHSGNTTFLKNAFGMPVAMQAGDVGMAKFGDMFIGRKKPNFLVRLLMAPLTGFGREERFSPDLLVEDGQDLLEYGLDARVLSLPGHSKGSLGILTRDGNLFCGDLFENRGAPALNTLMDDMQAAGASLRRLQEMEIRMVFPGHGEPFEWEKVANYLPG
jgi:glyoxylase-like metal-dependent hydrolase (beta-lactamase superfamily II)